MVKYLVLLALILIGPGSFAQNAWVGVGKIYDTVHRGSMVTTTADLLSNPRLTMSLPGWRVMSFTFSIKPSQNDYIGPIQVKGAEFTPELLKIIRTYSGVSGSIYFEDIKAVGPDRKPRSLSSILLKYKN